MNEKLGAFLLKAAVLSLVVSRSSTNPDAGRQFRPSRPLRERTEPAQRGLLADHGDRPGGQR